MLNSFKKKLTENFSTLKLSIPLSPKEPQDFPNTIHVSAGCALLDHYENSWKNVHNGTLESISLAERVDQKIIALQSNIKTMETNISDMNSCLQKVPAIRDTLKNCLDKICEIRNLCEKVELGIVGLQDVCETCDMQEKKLDEKYQLSLYKQKKIKDLETYRQNLAEKHQQTTNDYENKLRQMQKERQEVFESAFKNDLEEFKKSGNVPSKIFIYKFCWKYKFLFFSENLSTVMDKSTLLEEVVLDDIENNNDLESFLDDS